LIYFITIAVALAGGTIAALVHAPIPWLLGSLLLTGLVAGFGCRLQQPASVVEKWMRVLVGVALGPSVAGSLGNFGISTLLAVSASVFSIVLLVLAGSRFFKYYLDMTRGEAFLCSLPGGLSFMMALADDARVASRGSRPRIALVHTVRVVSLVLFVSFIAFVLNTNKSHGAFSEWFTGGLVFDVQWLLLCAVVVFSGVLANQLKIPGGHVTIPLLISSLMYVSGLIDLPVPQVVITVAMLTFGCILGCELGNGPHSEYPRLAAGSLLFTAAAFAIAAVLALLFGRITGIGFLTLFLALAPGGITEVALIALSLGLDVGLIAMVHLCRFMFIMLAGPAGLRVIGGQSNKYKPDTRSQT
jgi:membrane AbrB-like protein